MSLLSGKIQEGTFRLLRWGSLLGSHDGELFLRLAEVFTGRVDLDGCPRRSTGPAKPETFSYGWHDGSCEKEAEKPRVPAAILSTERTGHRGARLGRMSEGRQTRFREEPGDSLHGGETHVATLVLLSQFP